MRELMIPRFGYGDEARLIFRDGKQHWGALALFRGLDDPAFSPTEVAVLSRLSRPFARGVRSGIVAQAATSPKPALPGGPAVIIVDATDEIAQITPSAEARLELLRPDQHSGSPYGVLAALISAARSYAHGAPAEAAITRVRGTGGTWLTLQAVSLGGRNGHNGQVAITLEEARPPEILDLVMNAYALTPREQEVTRLILEGKDTREIVGDLHLSPHTVNDHLKSIFNKFDVHNRGQLIARVFGDFYAPRIGGDLDTRGSFAAVANQ